MDQHDPVSELTLAKWLQSWSPNYGSNRRQGNDYAILETNIHDGNNHSFYLYARQPEVQKALGWQPIPYDVASPPFLHH